MDWLMGMGLFHHLSADTSLIMSFPASVNEWKASPAEIDRGHAHLSGSRRLTMSLKSHVRRWRALKDGLKNITVCENLSNH